MAHNPGHSAVWKALGRAVAGAGRTDEAIEAWRRGIEAATSKGDIQAAKEMRVFRRKAGESALSPVHPEERRHRLPNCAGNRLRSENEGLLKLGLPSTYNSAWQRAIPWLSGYASDRLGTRFHDRGRHWSAASVRAT